MNETAPARSSFGRRVWRTLLLHADTYEEVEADRHSIRQALVIVALVSLAAGVGGWLPAAFGRPAPARLQIAVVVIEPFVIWLAAGAFAYMVGATFFRVRETETDYAEVLRTTGFAFSPGLLLLFDRVSPQLAGVSLVFLIAWVWILVASVVAVRQALDFTTLRAIGSYGVAFLLMWLVLWGLTVVPLPA